MKRIVNYLIRFYQKYLSFFSYGSCRYYPTCSQYALWQFENNTFFKAIYFTITRILKCNQLFKGGIDYPVIKLVRHNNINFKKIKIKYWYIPVNNNRYLVVKNREWNNNNDE
ncbi:MULTISPECIES: membrane protein insertion efficiency factor YidD [Malaciobacter]|jgi:putative membrane protein insertion efficiency factor|uniref:Putative membrane protein insertion efficiency factor n=2 Tax=Malaciobacter TaxID=2321114 RepID=A0AB36ZYZ2_9BACT|nr:MULTISPECIES: membrane protein insertion efficiency factor YidD [Malaciobacter]PHO09435.1 membrane protein insertion efficiency factor YidD [Malaciobacter canalis]PPK60872.1 putative membrane protein insertion efficiency factor [Malaciobacter marinus]QEE33559.1 membrane protein insertion efficiency factor, YidD family [Malaciobacter canalis]SKB63194.1 putative membrane protein insertion efficiency factor [Malaciobacter marinus]